MIQQTDKQVGRRIETNETTKTKAKGVKEIRETDKTNQSTNKQQPQNNGSYNNSN